MRHIAGVEAVQHPAFLVRAEPDRGILRVFGELDFQSAPELLSEATERPNSCRSIIVDLAALMFIDAAGLGALVSLRDRCQAAGNRFSVTGASTGITRVFELAGLVEMLNSGLSAIVIPLPVRARSRPIARALPAGV